MYPTSLGGGQYRIGAVRDLTTGHDSGQPDGRAILPVSSSSQMITFTFSEPEAVLTLRTSGTEPKIKWYSEIRAQPGQTDRDAVKRQLDALVAAMVDELMQPEQNGLIARKE
ncbi:Phosphoglucomutase-2 [Amphibalanus amphitrite]|uniref:Phosphoglucomutase-2 n=1 Tax=Amphibalanus amphitrite TaxID=1232801 RepID=A0A6A4XDV7_AMPAM|nr:Phosphoglucomutase-2 [Amphibalanus amphitrite]